MCAAGSRIDWFVVADDDGCDMLPLIAGDDSSVIAKEVTFEASEFLPPAFEELPFGATVDFVLYGDHQLFTEIDGATAAESKLKTVSQADEDVVPIPTLLLCDICQLRFKCKSHLKRHQLLFHEDEPGNPKKDGASQIHCRQCDVSLASVKQLKIHLSKQHPQRLVCDLCLTAFQHEASLVWHRNYHLSKGNGSGKHVCDVCRKQCASSSHLHLHRKIHLEQKPYPCTFGCDRSFSSSGNRQKHIARMHTREQKYRCTHCNESFIYARQLQLHRERKHAELSRFSKGFLVCTRCKEPFDTEQSFQQHVTNFDCPEHRPFECVFCSSRFKQATHLRNHLLTHEKDARAYGCEFCPKRFALAGDLKVHRRTHTKEKPFRCNLCPAGFTMGKQLNKHRFKVHQIENEKMHRK
ncbi:zinc finger protein 271-like [Anopheles stephensi]|uniref:zinc finger protein 271-like n=1 Tax=Anopheles stephensi TaxID=30069 RepID=UPI001658BB5C|nr:zinc finger protein 271-like [Anopheles stephensi]